jgi:hypothetical protein
MQIDRSKFLLFTASIASAGCGSNSSSSSGGAVVVAAPIVTLPDPSVSGTNATVAGATTKPGQTAGSATDEEVLAAADRTPGAAAEDSSMCDDSGPAPTGCSSIRAPSSQCESFSETKSMCSKLARGLKPKVAEKAVECLLAKSGKQPICVFGVANDCAMAAVKKACIDPATQVQCAPVVRHCGGRLDMRDCQNLLSAVVSSNRREMIACMTEGCSTEYCMYDVR